uniref:Core shell protein Gag P30 domain-containing protein n=1 Tax=Anolis carolinensis TaxID=28377 RepID=A0A803SKY4_ANOCA
MGGKESKESGGSMTPLQCMLNNFEQFKKYTTEKGMRPNKLRALCELEWVSFPLTPQWPSKGSLDPVLILSVYRFVADVHPNQFKYISAWYDVVRKQPEWLGECECMNVDDVMTERKRGVGSGDSQREIDTPMGKKWGRQYLPYPNSGDPAHEPMPARPYTPALYPPLSPLKGGGAMGRFHPTAAARVPVREPVMGSSLGPYLPPEESEWNLNGAKAQALEELEQMRRARRYGKLSEVESPQLVPISPDDQGNHRFGTRNLFQYKPFTSLDILNIKKARPAWTEDPRGMANLVEGIILTHNPSWMDLKQLIEMLLTAEERVLLTQVGRQEAVREHANSNSLDAVDVYQEKVFPVRVDPRWDPNTANGRDSLRLYQKLIVCALKKGTPRVPNVRRIYQMEQEQDESPVAFLERLREAFEKFSPYDMKDWNDHADGKIVLKSVFISQCWPDIRRELQKEVGLAHLTLERILEIANQVYLSREAMQVKREEARASHRAKVLAAVFQGDQPSWGPVAAGLVDPALDVYGLASCC